MSPAGFEPAIPASERQQTHALKSAATWIGNITAGAWELFLWPHYSRYVD